MYTVVYKMALGSAHTCIINNINHIICFGDNKLYQIAVPDMKDIYPNADYDNNFINLSSELISAGSDHTCAIVLHPESKQQRASDLVCWGDEE